MPLWGQEGKQEFFKFFSSFFQVVLNVFSMCSQCVLTLFLPCFQKNFEKIVISLDNE